MKQTIKLLAILTFLLVSFVGNALALSYATEPQASFRLYTADWTEISKAVAFAGNRLIFSSYQNSQPIPENLAVDYLPIPVEDLFVSNIVSEGYGGNQYQSVSLTIRHPDREATIIKLNVGDTFAVTGAGGTSWAGQTLKVKLESVYRMPIDQRPYEPVCGNATCEKGENFKECPTDCQNPDKPNYGYRVMSVQCYDGFEEKQGGESSCKPSELWSKYAAQTCENRCAILENIPGIKKCGVNTFKLYDECGEGYDKPTPQPRPLPPIEWNENSLRLMVEKLLKHTDFLAQRVGYLEDRVSRLEQLLYPKDYPIDIMPYPYPKEPAPTTDATDGQGKDAIPAPLPGPTTDQIQIRTIKPGVIEIGTGAQVVATQTADVKVEDGKIFSVAKDRPTEKKEVPLQYISGVLIEKIEPKKWLEAKDFKIEPAIVNGKTVYNVSFTVPNNTPIINWLIPREGKTVTVSGEEVEKLKTQKAMGKSGIIAEIEAQGLVSTTQ